MINLSKGSHVDIQLTNGTLVRGTVAVVKVDVVVIENKPAIHSVHGILEFEKVIIDRAHVMVVGFRDDTNEY